MLHGRCKKSWFPPKLLPKCGIVKLLTLTPLVIFFFDPQFFFPTHEAHKNMVKWISDAYRQTCQNERVANNFEESDSPCCICLLSLYHNYNKKYECVLMHVHQLSETSFFIQNVQDTIYKLCAYRFALSEYV